MTNDTDVNYDDIDFSKQKRGKGKNKSDSKRWSLFVIEGIIVLIAIVVGGRFLFSDNADVSHLQATISAQNDQPSLSAEEFLERALIDKDEGLIDDAIRNLDLAIELNPSYAEAYFERAELRFDQEQYYYAANDYESALQHDVDDPMNATYKLGRANFQRESYWQAINAFDQLLSQDADHERAQYWRGRSYVEVGEYQQGIEGMLQAIELGYSELEFAYFYIARAYEFDEDYASAIRYYTLSIEHSTDDCEEYLCWIDYNNRGVSHYRSGDYESAREDFTTAIEVNPDEYPLAMKNRGDAHEQLGDMTLALSDWNTMFQLIEGDIVTRSLTADSNILRDKLDTTETQVHVSFEGSVGDSITVELTVPDDSALDAMLILRDANGSPVAYSAPADDHNAQLSDIVLADSGTYTIVVASNLGQSSGEFVLSLE